VVLGLLLIVHPDGKTKLESYVIVGNGMYEVSAISLFYTNLETNTKASKHVLAGRTKMALKAEGLGYVKGLVDEQGAFKPSLMKARGNSSISYTDDKAHKDKKSDKSGGKKKLDFGSDSGDESENDGEEVVKSALEIQEEAANDNLQKARIKNIQQQAEEMEKQTKDLKDNGGSEGSSNSDSGSSVRSSSGSGVNSGVVSSSSGSGVNSSSGSGVNSGVSTSGGSGVSSSHVSSSGGGGSDNMGGSNSNSTISGSDDTPHTPVREEIVDPGCNNPPTTPHVSSQLDKLATELKRYRDRDAAKKKKKGDREEAKRPKREQEEKKERVRVKQEEKDKKLQRTIAQSVQTALDSMNKRYYIT
jgi:hypothetical protein